jgi:uncharacterized protein YxjI
MADSALDSTKLHRDTFMVKQKHRSWMTSKYYVFDDAGTPLFYVERQKLLRKANIVIYDDDTKGRALLTIRQEHGYAALRRVYTLIDELSGEHVAGFDRDNIRSWLRRAWTIADRDGKPIAGAREDTAVIAAFRRILEFVPFVSIVVGLVRTNFHLHVVDDAGVEQQVGTFNRKLSFGDKYKLDLTADPDRRLDRRIALATGILLDTGEAR